MPKMPKMPKILGGRWCGGRRHGARRAGGGEARRCLRAAILNRRFRVGSQRQMMSGLERAVSLAPVREVRGQEALEDFAVVGNKQMDELVHDDVFDKGLWECQELGVKGEAAGGRDRGPFRAHGSQMNLGDFDADARGPMPSQPTEIVGRADGRLRINGRFNQVRCEDGSAESILTGELAYTRCNLRMALAASIRSGALRVGFSVL